MRRAAIVALLATAAWAGDWSAPVEVRHDENLCLSYQARLDGGYLVVRTKIEPGWHTFAMDNKVRAEEKLAGKKSLGIDHPTEIAARGGIELAGPWLQTPPKDFSHPELRWFSWGFEREATFTAKVRKPVAGRITIRGQACTDSICKNIDVEVAVPASGGAASDLHTDNLIPVQAPH